MAKFSTWLSGMDYQVLYGNPEEAEVQEVVYDSRKAVPGTVFVCMKGSKVDSHRFLPGALAQGAGAFVVEENAEALPVKLPLENACVVKVDSAREALARLSAARFGYPMRELTVIGITGTKGKTTTAHMIYSILTADGRETPAASPAQEMPEARAASVVSAAPGAKIEAVASSSSRETHPLPAAPESGKAASCVAGMIGTIGVRFGEVFEESKNTTPESYELQHYARRMADAGCKYLVMEASSQGFKLARTAGILFDYGILSNLEPDHIGPDEHQDFAEYKHYKSYLFKQSKIGFLNQDMDYAEEFRQQAPCRLYTYGTDIGNSSSLHPEPEQAAQDVGSIGYAQDGGSGTGGMCADESGGNRGGSGDGKAPADFQASHIRPVHRADFTGVAFDVTVKAGVLPALSQEDADARGGGSSDGSGFDGSRCGNSGGGRFGSSGDSGDGGASFHVEMDLPGKYNVYNALSAISLALVMGIPRAQILKGLREIRVDGRMEVAFRNGKMTVLVDYAHNAMAMENLLRTLREYEPKRLVVVFGCGGNRSKDRRYGMGRVAAEMADLSILTADNSRFERTEDIIADIKSALIPAGGKYVEVLDRREAIAYAMRNAQEGDMIAVIGKGHENYNEVNGQRTHFLDREVVQELAAELL